ncbi:PREDICTED: UDP-GlcNAc:betaGal beta-1,3-N-acetylglucosaminyltransferase-like protein 1 [Rhagoletis zephyria]|uniref:UDP-GlcNAc:betaGal beta-1,3-N-acetylglucosaminyltransferase-like protein 1 n=1 Tax=Rhagoletis zephyria TaxID=28612 RepID=UPI0008112378|nr:PREDICTED: UDP-GlcNAc:betaGal beta-1,3-N-acetylglucosaminyltransferase-like protein 1 [Rhagoletis zephyria]
MAKRGLTQCTAVHIQKQQMHLAQQHLQRTHNRVTSTAKEEEVENNKKFKIEVCVFDDCSTDCAAEILLQIAQRKFYKKGIRTHIVRNESDKPETVDYGSNRPIEVACGTHFCFQDIDDKMLLARCNMNALCRILIPIQEIYTANGPAVIMPIWLCHQQVYERITGGFCEHGHDPAAATFLVFAETFWQLLCSERWRTGLTIWNAHFSSKKVSNFILKKINKSYNHYEKQAHRFTYLVPIVHFTHERPLMIFCMKLNLTNSAFEANLNSLHLNEGRDYVLFT